MAENANGRGIEWQRVQMEEEVDGRERGWQSKRILDRNEARGKRPNRDLGKEAEKERGATSKSE